MAVKREEAGTGTLLRGASLIFSTVPSYMEAQQHHSMTALDPNVLNPYILLDPAVAPAASIAFTLVSAALAIAISRRFFRSYSFSGFGYLLGLPAGFAFLAASFVLELASFAHANYPILHPALFWIQQALQSEAFALIVLSYLLYLHRWVTLS
ncbi:MAG: hypothetical protein C4292_02145, partial [Nitrososphaera sp.]